VENVVKMTHGRRQGKLIGLQSHTLENFVGSQAFPVEFLRRAGGGDVRSVEPYHIARLELDSFVFGIVIASLSILSVFDILDKTIVCFLEMETEVGGGGGGMFSWDLELGDEARVVTVVCEERRHLCGFLGSIVVREFRKREQVEPVVLIVVAGDTEVGFERLIHPLCLTVGLWMKGGRFAGIKLEDGGEGGPEKGGKNGSTVGNNRIREAVESDDVRNEEFSKFRSVSSLRTGDEVAHLGHSINKHED